jgi:hypothetical protein
VARNCADAGIVIMIDARKTNLQGPADVPGEAIHNYNLSMKWTEGNSFRASRVNASIIRPFVPGLRAARLIRCPRAVFAGPDLRCSVPDDDGSTRLG